MFTCSFLSCIFVLILSRSYVVCDIYGAHPKIRTENGNLLIISADSKNITFRTDGNGAVNLNNINILSVVERAINVSRNLERILSDPDQGVGDFVRRLSDIIEGPRGLIRRVSALENGTLSSGPASTGLGRNRRFLALARRITSVERRLNRLVTLLNKNECKSNPCKHGGSCLDLYNGFLCTCIAGWQGTTCEEDVNECANFAGTDLGCQNGATCINKPGTYECVCTTGWFGTHCTRRSTDCNSGSQAELCGHGVCVQQRNEHGYTCLCDQGWKTNGVSLVCNVDVDECAGRHPCSMQPFVPCINLPGSFTCGTCPAGYGGSGFTCIDIDECQENNGGCSTDPMVQCTNTIGSRTCANCPHPYTGDGVNCVRGRRTWCQLFDHYCHPQATCTERPGVVPPISCECPAGYTGTGIGFRGCEAFTANDPRDPCNPNPCRNGTCLPHRLRANVTCVCNAGFTGQFCDVSTQPCSRNPCQNGGTCTSTGTTTFRCECPATHTGKLCQRESRACGGVLSAASGTLEYPLTNSSLYISNARCAWVIQTNNTKVLNITFTKFHLEESTECQFDWLQIHDGRSTASSLIGRYCGPELPNKGSIISTHNSLYLWFRSDHSVSGEGFKLHWNSIDPVCGDTLMEATHGVISSPGSPGNYPPNRDCIWIINAPMGKRIQLHFFTLRIEGHPDCKYDYLEIINGDRPSDPTIAKYCNTTRPEPLVTPGSIVQLHFHSDAFSSDTGFQIAYSAIEGIPGCGGVYTADSGELGSPINDGSYPVNMFCDYKIQLPANTKIEIEFTSFKMEHSNDCTFDYVAIYEGPTDESPLVARYCGEQIPPRHTIDSNVVLVVFRSDWSVTSEGFRLKYRAACGGVFSEPSGFIESAGYPNAYFSERVCEYIVQYPVGKAVQLEFLEFDLEGNSYPDCFYDYLAIHDGDNDNSTLIDSYCGETLPPKILSTHNYLYMKMATDSTVSGKGFRAKYSAVDIACGGILKAPNDVITCPMTNDEYPDEARCTWVISGAPGTVVQVTWMNFHLEESSNCTYDYVAMYDNRTGSQGDFIGRYCGTSLPPSVTSSANVMTIIFRSDRSRGGEGFMASYTTLDASKACGGKFFTNTGVVRSPGWPSEYPGNKDCVWVIQAPHGQQIALNVTQFELESHSTCKFDYLEIRNGGYESSPLMGKYCDNTIPKTLSSLSNQLYIKFHSDMSKSAPGFVITWDSTSTGCGGSWSSAKGSVISPHYPQPYGRNAECAWRISGPAGSKMQVVIMDLDMENHHSCNFDYIEFYDGLDLTSEKIGRYCSSEDYPSLIQFKTNHILIRMRSDPSTEGRGFMLSYNSVCNNELTGYRGVIESANFPQRYPGDMDCTWRIVAPKGNKINVTFSHFDLEDAPSYFRTREGKKCNFDYLEIKDESENDHTQSVRGHYCGNELPSPFTSVSSIVSLKFKTDTLLSGNGFRLEWVIEGCGGVLTRPEGTIQSPNYPHEYPHNLVCEWLIKTDYDQSIHFEMIDFDMEHVENCMFDGLAVFDGTNANASKLMSLCHSFTGNASSAATRSNGNYMFVRFYTDNTFSGRGFKALYKSVPGRCGGRLSGHDGFLYSPNYPKNYGTNEDCKWIVEVNPLHVVQVNFMDFDLESYMNCTSDFVRIYDGEEISPDKLLMNHCGNTMPSPLSYRASGNKVLVHFRSDQLYSAKGFKANFTTTCGAKITTNGTGIIDAAASTLYRKFANCSWTIISEDPGKKVTVTITRFNVPTYAEDEHGYCSENFFKIFEGVSAEGPLLGHYCGNKIPPSITSQGNALTIVKGVDFYTPITQSFSLTYSVLDSACGGTLTGVEGYFTSPNYPNSYPNNAECVWLLPTSVGNKVELLLEVFDVQKVDEECNNDFLEIRTVDGLGELKATLCGDQTQEYRLVSEKPLWLKFRSGEDGTAKGFMAHFTYVHGNEISGQKSGQISSPMYPLEFTSAGTFNWRVIVDSQHVISVSFKYLYIDLFDGEDCLLHLKIFDGYDSNAPELLSVCGYANPDPVLSTSNVIYIKLKNDWYRIGSKFLLDWTQTRRTIGVPSAMDIASNVTGCGSSEVLELATGQMINLTSPDYPHGYIGNLKCEWIISVPTAYRPAIHFTDVDLEETSMESGCILDYIEVFTGVGGGTSDWKLLQTVCLSNATQLPDIKADTFMKVVFTSDAYINKTGFSAQVYADCGGSLTGPSGVITLGNMTERGTSNHRNAIAWECQWNVTVRPGKTISVQITEIDIPSAPGTGTCLNYVILKNGHSSASPLLGDGKYCGTVPVFDLETTGNNLYIRFYSLDTSQQKLKIKYKEVNTLCGDTITLSRDNNSTLISSPNYPNIPPPHSECEWVVMSPTGEIVRADFQGRFDLSNSVFCTVAYVELRDGATDSSPPLGKSCGSNKPGTVRSTGNAMYVKFFTNAPDPKNGFQLKLSLDSCGGTYRGKEGKVSSPNYPIPGAYPPRSTCDYRIVGLEGHFLNLEFKDLSLPANVNCSAVDHVEIYEIITPNAMNFTLNPISKYCGSNKSAEISTSSNEVLVRFVTGIVQNSYKGFQLYYNSSTFSCGGSIDDPSGEITSPGYPLGRSHSRFCEWAITVPQGRRVTVEILDLDLQGRSYTFNEKLSFYNDHDYMSRITSIKGGENYTSTIESSSNKMMIDFWGRHSSSNRGFKLRFSSDKASYCRGNMDEREGLISPPSGLESWHCEWLWTRTDRNASETLALTFTDVQLSQRTRNCQYSPTNINIRSNGKKKSVISQMCGNITGPVVVRSSLRTTMVMVNQLSTSSLVNFTMKYRVHACGGRLRIGQRLTHDDVPHNENFAGQADCAWRVRGDEGQRLQIKINNLNIALPCDQSYLLIYNGRLPTSPLLYKLCGSEVPSGTTVTQSSDAWIEYHAASYSPDTRFDISVEEAALGCGGVLHSGGSQLLESPNFGPGKQYPHNAECTWEIRGEEGYHIGLVFQERFFLENSPNCTKDFVEIWDYVGDDWRSLGRVCGRTAPGAFNSSASMMRIMFRSDGQNAGDGFKARWDKNCGGIIEATKNKQILTSPGYPAGYGRQLLCNYTIISKNQNINVKFTDFELENGQRGCVFDNLTIYELPRFKWTAFPIGIFASYYASMKTIGSYCGTTPPAPLRVKDSLAFVLQTDKWIQRRGFKLEYYIDDCGGLITEPGMIESPKSTENPDTYMGSMDCYWNITAPAGKNVVLRIDHLDLEWNPACYYDAVSISDGIGETSKKMANLCGDLRNATMPILRSTNNSMTVRMRTDNGVERSGFRAHVLFVPGQSQGCGGEINVTDNEVQLQLAPNLMTTEGYRGGLDCHWTFNTSLGKNIRLDFTDFHLAPCVNHTNRDAELKCNCDYLEVRDGSTVFSPLVGVFCGHMLPDTVISSLSSLWVRFVSDGEYTSSGFVFKYKAIPSMCGPSVLDVTSTQQTLTSPGFPAAYAPSLHCTWMLAAPPGSRVDLHVAKVDLQAPDPDGLCSNDVLEIADKKHSSVIMEGLGDDFTYSKMPKDIQMYAHGSAPISRHFLCGTVIPTDYYSGENEMIIRFTSDASEQRSGFKLTYSIAACSRNYSHTQGRIMYDNLQGNCLMTVTAPENYTLALYFQTFLMYSSQNDCEDNYLEVFDREVSTATKLVKLCGFETPDPIFSNSSTLVIKTFSNPGIISGSILDITYTSTDQGPGCGGVLFNYAGCFSSPKYPQIYRKAGTCTWDVSVPNGHRAFMKFIVFDLGSANTCQTDYIEVVDMDLATGAEKSVTRYCGGDKPAIFKATSNMLRVRYTTTINNGGTGWLANFIASTGNNIYDW